MFSQILTMPARGLFSKGKTAFKSRPVLLKKSPDGALPAAAAKKGIYFSQSFCVHGATVCVQICESPSFLPPSFRPFVVPSLRYGRPTVVCQALKVLPGRRGRERRRRERRGEKQRTDGRRGKREREKKGRGEEREAECASNCLSQSLSLSLLHCCWQSAKEEREGDEKQPTTWWLSLTV